MKEEKFLLLQYIKDNTNSKIDNIEQIREDIERKYPNDKCLYVELANYYINNNDINNAIKCLERYRQNNGEDIDVLILLSKKYMDVKSFEKAKHLLEELSAKNKENKEIEGLLFSVEKSLNNINIKEMNENSECSIEDEADLKHKEEIRKPLVGLQNKKNDFNEIQEIFNKDFDTIVKEIKKIFVSKQEYDYYLMLKLIEKKLRKLNIKKEYSKVKLFFDEIYTSIPDEQLKLKNIILNEYEISSKKIILKSYPRKIEFALTNKCNFRCIMCDKISHSGDYSASDKTVDDLIELIPYLQSLILRGGEVFLDSRLNKILEQCKRNGVSVEIITNGSLLNNENMSNLLDNDKMIITLSIDSLKQTTYEKIRKHGDFNNLLNIIKSLNEIRKQKQSRTTIGVNMVVMSINYTEIEDMINFVGVNNFRFINLIPVLHNSQYNLDTNIINEINCNNKKYLNIAKKYNVEIFNRIPLNNYEVNTGEIVTNGKDDKKTSDSKQEKMKNKEIGKITKKEINNKEVKNEDFCIKPFYYMLIDKDIMQPTCFCKMLEDNPGMNENSNNTILASWNGVTFCNYRKAMLSDDKYKFCSDECVKNNLLFNCDDE